MTFPFCSVRLICSYRMGYAWLAGPGAQPYGQDECNNLLGELDFTFTPGAGVGTTGKNGSQRSWGTDARR